MPKPVLIDTDTGVDDALALIFALCSPELSVQAITTVAGNVEVEKCTRNVLFLLRKLDLQNKVKVAQGAARPLKRALFTAPEVHGQDGLGNIFQQNNKQKKAPTPSTKAVKEILDFCQRNGKKGCIIAIGPLTNLALAYQQQPKVFRKVGSIITMGGAFRVSGNTGPVAEFNYYVDPEAAHLILNSGLPVTVVPLDVTEQVILQRHKIKQLARRSKKPISKEILRFTDFYMKYHKITEGFYGGFAHDPMAIAVAMAPHVIQTRRICVSVDTQSRELRGMTFVPLLRKKLNDRYGVDIAVAVQKRKFLWLFYERLFT